MTLRTRLATRSLVCTLGLMSTFLLMSAAGAQVEGSDGMAEIDRCLGENSPEQTMIQETEITTLDRTGSDRTQEAKLYWKRSKKGQSRMFMRVESPPELRGSAYLVIQYEDRPNDMWMYLPEIRKVRRISSRTVSGSLFGTDFSYEDVEYIQLSATGSTSRRLADAELDGRPVYVIESLPGAGAGSAYTRVVAFIDHEYCVPLKTQFYEDGDTLRKLMTADPTKISREVDSWVPRDVVMKDLRRGTASHLVVKEIGIDTEIPDRRFTQSQLERRN